MENQSSSPTGEDRYKDRLLFVANAIRDSYVTRTSEDRFAKEVLAGLARRRIDDRWLWAQFERLAEEATACADGSSFDVMQNWRALGANEGNNYELLYLLRLLWSQPPDEGNSGSADEY